MAFQLAGYQTDWDPVSAKLTGWFCVGLLFNSYLRSLKDYARKVHQLYDQQCDQLRTYTT
jgi:hypothetical protein